MAQNHPHEKVTVQWRPSGAIEWVTITLGKYGDTWVVSHAKPHHEGVGIEIRLARENA